MPLLACITDKPQPYVLGWQRKPDFAGTQTVFWIKPLAHRQTQSYFSRRTAEGENKRVPATIMAGKLSDVDEETLRAAVVKIENVYEDGDVVEDAPGIAHVIAEMLDWNMLQELLVAATSQAALADGAKNG